MGLLRAEIVELAKIINSIESPSVLMIGKQDIYADFSDIRELMDIYGYEFNYDYQDEESVVDADKLFLALGAKEVKSLDYSNYEGADIIYDLNCYNCTNDLKGRFNLVIDGGVLEHIFRPDIGIRNISDFVSVGGYIYHMLPCSGLINHGFYSFSPTFFCDYYQKPYWEIKSLRMQYKPERGIYKFVFYSMDCRLFINQDGVNKYVTNYWDKGGEVLIQCVSQKLKELDDGFVDAPIQGLYREIYKGRL